MTRNSVRVLALLGMLAAPAAAHAQLSGDTRESARPLSHEGMPAGESTAAAAPAPPDSGLAPIAAPSAPARTVKWAIGSGGRLDDAATAFGANATMIMTGATILEIRGEYTRRTPDGVDGVDGVGGQLKLFLPETWTPPSVTVATSAEGGWEFESGRTWSVKSAADLKLTKYVLVGFTGGYHESQPEEGAAVSGFVPAGALTVIPVTGTEVSLQYRLDNRFHGEDRTELAVSHRFQLSPDRAIYLRGSVAKHGTLAVGLSYRP